MADLVPESSLFTLLGEAPHDAASDVPLRYGVLVFDGYEPLDAHGPLEFFQSLSYWYPLTLSVIAADLEPKSTKPSGFGTKILPTHTYKSAPPLDVLLVPGGLGTKTLIEDAATLEFIRDIYPGLKYILTVCSGSTLLAKAGILDGRRATSNKAVWAEMVASGPKVNWVAEARWVVDENIWTSSGVTAGMDLAVQFIKTVYSEAIATIIANVIEYTPNTDPSLDPFAAVWKATWPLDQ